MFVTNWISTTKIQKISEITNFFRHYFLSRTEVFMDSSDVNIAIRIWSKPYSIDKVKTIHGKEFTLINLPFYLIGNLRNVLDAVVEE